MLQMIPPDTAQLRTEELGSFAIAAFLVRSQMVAHEQRPPCQCRGAGISAAWSGRITLSSVKLTGCKPGN